MFNVGAPDLSELRETDAIEIEQPDGGVIIRFPGSPGITNNDINAIEDDGEDVDFYENLVDFIEPSALSFIAHELLDGIETDDRSRAMWIADRQRGLDLLALQLKTPRSDVGSSGSPMDGMSTVQHPLLLEACIKFQSNTKRELLPADGPVKIKNEGKGTAEQDELAERWQRLMNRYFTEFSPEYYPDTDKMFFEEGFSGMGFKKPFHCPLRRRPVSDTVEAKDLIVSNDATDMKTAHRVTQRINMTHATLKRMQFVGAYADVELSTPDGEPVDPLKKKQGNLSGVSSQIMRQQDQTYTLFESYTFLDIPGIEHLDDDGTPSGLPMPYKVTIDKTSRQVLELRRNWVEDDETYSRRINYVAYNFVPTFGFYASGLLHILGNPTTAATGAWRILLDNGMFANFPGFLYAKSGGRQDDLNFRVPPGGGAAVDIGGAEDIRKTVMPLPYNTGNAQALMDLTQDIVATGQSVGGAANFIDPAGIKQNMPVGTLMSLIEQNAQMISAVHERNFVSQSQEFQAVVELLREDPDALWRLIEGEGVWTREDMEAALYTYALVPVADPNTPTHIHRLQKMTALKQLSTETPGLYDPKAVDTRILRAMKIDDPESLFAPPPTGPGAAPPTDPAVIIATATAQTKQAEIASRERIEQMKAQIEQQRAQDDARMEEMKLAIQQLIAKEKNETTIEVANISAQSAHKKLMADYDTQSKSRDQQERLSPFNNHDKVIATKKAAPPRPANGAKKPKSKA